MDTNTTRVGLELPPTLRAQYLDISSDPKIKLDWNEEIEKVKKKDHRLFSSDESPHHFGAKSDKPSPKQGNITSNTEHSLYPIYPQEVDLNDLPSQYTEYLKTSAE